MKRLFSLLALAFLMYTVPAFAQFGGVIQQSSLLTATGVTGAMATGNTSTAFNMGLYQLSWTGTGTRTTCTIGVEAASTATGTYTGIGTTQTCTSDGSYSFFVQPASTNAWVHVNLSVLTGAGNTVNFIFTGFNNTPVAPALALGSVNAALSLNGNTLSGELQPNTAVGATLAPTCAAQSGSVISVGATGGEVVTLPAPTVGCWFDFVITVSNTSASNEIRTDAGTHFLLGAVEHSASGIAPLTFWADGTSIQAIKMDGAHLGGLIGSFFHVVGISTTQWEITGRNEGTATMTTAFTATP